MLKTAITHPAILNTFASLGHGSVILIADGNFPVGTHGNPMAERVFLNLFPGMVSITDTLSALLNTIPVEAVHVMRPDDGTEPEIYSNFRQMLPTFALQPLDRFAFYEMTKHNDVGLIIATGDSRLWANILLTVGVVAPE